MLFGGWISLVNPTIAGSVGVVERKLYRFDYLVLDCGQLLSPVDIAYETYGSLNRGRTNAVLVCHALSGDSHAAGYYVGEDRAGWWDAMIGPGKPIDTTRYFVICSNVIGGCKGSTGPSSINPRTGEPYGLSFPLITIRDMVRAQKRLVEAIGIERLLCVIGGSMGGMQALQWSVSYPGNVRTVVSIAATARHSPQQIAFGEVGRRAIMADPDWCGGYYYGSRAPARGLALARMIGHITYMSEELMHSKFGRQQIGEAESPKESPFAAEFEVEGYLHKRGNSFIQRFDANSYLYITKAMDLFDLAEGGNLADRFAVSRGVRFLILAFSSDWLYPPYQSQEIVKALKQNGIDVTYCELPSQYGHDSFLVDIENQGELVRHFLEKAEG